MVTLSGKGGKMPKKSPPVNRGRGWKMERASVSVPGRKTPRSNKYRASDADEKPTTGERSRAWVGGYTRADGRKVKGHYRALSQPPKTNPRSRTKRGSLARLAKEV